jgi:hypothetical protein
VGIGDFHLFFGDRLRKTGACHHEEYQAASPRTINRNLALKHTDC